jgi:hypothetical protein
VKHALFTPLFLGLFLPLPPSMAAAPSANSQQVLAGLQHPSLTHWSRMQTIEFEGGERTEDLDCHFHVVIDLRRGAGEKINRVQCSLRRKASAPLAPGARIVWGQAHSLDSPEAETLTVADRWLNRGWSLASQQLPAVLKALSPATDQGVRHERLDAMPLTGRRLLVVASAELSNSRY